MAYEVKYRCEWTDIQQDDWRVDILENNYAGAISAMIASGSPLTIDYLTPGDDLTLGPIKGSMATLRVECTTNFEYIGLYSEADLVRKVNVYKNEVLYWAGWLSNEYTEPYDNVPYTVEITATDGLGILKYIPYKNGTLEYTGREIETDIILRVLGKIGHTTFTEYCNLYEDRMDDAVDDSPFDQALIDNDLFIDADCYSVLTAILIKYNAVIRQRAGVFIIYRPTELVQDTVYGRVITATTTTGTSITPDKVIDREALDLIDVEGGVLMYKPPMTTFTAVQDYGYKDSWLKNHKFNTWSLTSEFANWTRVGSFGIIPAKDGGITFITPAGSTGANNSHYVWQDFGTHGKLSTTDVLRLTFGYDIDNQTGVAADVTIKIALYDDTRVHSLSMVDDTELFQWDNGSYNRIQWTVADVPPGQNSYTFDQSVMGIPCDGGFHIRLYYTIEATYLTIKDLSFTITSDQLNKVEELVKKWIIPGLIKYTYMRELPVEVIDREEVVGREYLVTNSVQGEEGKQSYIIGDVEDTGIVNVLEQFVGSLAIELGGSLSQTATDFINDFTDDYAALVGPSVLLTSSGSTLYFTSAEAGDNFTGSTSIVPVGASTLTGVVSTVTANSTGTKQKETLTFTAGSTGDFYIYSADIDATGSWDTNLDTTLAAFDTAYSAAFTADNITLTHTATTLVFEETNAGGGFERPSFLSDPGGNYVATWATTAPGYVAAVGPIARVDRIILSGTSGTATVTCHANSETITFNTDTVLLPTTSWHTRGNTEALPLAELIGDEVADMYSKGRQFIQLSMYELTESLDLLNNLQDPLNLVGANNRVFAFNRGSLDCQAREWTIDIIEIGDK